MERAKSNKKFVMGLLGLSSVMVFAGAAIDMRTHSDEFMDQYTFQFEEAQVSARTVASTTTSPAVQYFPLNQDNALYINGKWEIMRIIGQKGDDLFNKYENENDKKKSIEVEFELIGTSLIKVDEDDRQIYRLSLLTEFDTALLFKEMDSGYEILEVKKVKAAAPSVVAQERTSQQPAEQKVLPAGLLLSGELDLTLERALHPSRSANMLTGEHIRGSMSIVDGAIQSLAVTLNYGNGQREEIDIGFAEINDGGQFETMVEDDIIHGIITNNGEGVFRVRFATGKLQGAMLNFVTDDKLDELVESQYNQEENEQEAQDFQTEHQYGDNTQVFDQSVIEQETVNADNLRREQQREALSEFMDTYDEEFKDDYPQDQGDNYDQDEVSAASVEKMNQKVEASGFDFGSERSIASINE